MSIRRLLSLLVLSLSIFNASVFAGEPVPENAAKQASGEKKGINITELVFGHVSDSHEWHLFSISNGKGESRPVALPLPMILYQPGLGFTFMSSGKFEEWHDDGTGKKISNTVDGFYIEKDIKEKVIAEDGSKVYDLSITRNVLSMLIGVALLLWAMMTAAKKYQASPMKAPSGFQNAIEAIVVFLRDEVAIPNLGSKYLRFTPLLLTIFFFIWINNLLGLLPGGANFTGNIAVTGCLALVTFFVMMANSTKYFWGHLLNPPGLPLLVKMLLVLIEVMSLIIKPVALMIRLFANMLAGHIVILSVICLIFIFAIMNTYVGSGFVLVSLAFSIFMFMLELLVAVIQAFIFVNLTAVFIGQAIESHHGHDDHGHHEGHKAIA